MLNAPKLFRYFNYAITAAFLYCLSVWIFIRDASFTDSWMLYVGNTLFSCVIAVFIFRYNRKRDEKASTIKMMIAGLITTIKGVIVSCIISFLLLWIFAPKAINPASNTAEKLIKSPVQLNGKSNGLVMILYMNAINGNISMASFLCIMLPFAVTKSQKGENEPSKELL